MSSKLFQCDGEVAGRKREKVGWMSRTNRGTGNFGEVTPWPGLVGGVSGRRACRTVYEVSVHIN